jgi:hypothetical protein
MSLTYAIDSPGRGKVAGTFSVDLGDVDGIVRESAEQRLSVDWLG